MYHAITLATIWSAIAAIQGLSYSFLSQFDYFDYFCLFCSAFFALINQILKQLAVHYDTASRVTIYNYLQSLIQLVADIVIFDY